MKINSKFDVLNPKGSTLIEVLVTIFVLTSGLLVLMGIFPHGFSILQHSRNVGYAGGLMRDRSASLTMREDNMPVAIIPCDDNGNSFDAVNINPNEGKPNSFVMENGEYIQNGGSYQRGTLLSCRRVVGESTVIPGGDHYTTANGEFYGGKYTLLFGPIDTARNTNTKKLKRFVIYGSPMTNLEAGFTSTNPSVDMWNDAGYTSYWAPNGDGRLYLAFAPYYAYTRRQSEYLDYNRIYKISYNVRHETTGQTFRKEGYIQVDKNYSGEWSCAFQDFDINNYSSLGSQNMTTVGSGYVMLPDSLRVCRVFEEVTPGKSFGLDPYQFSLADPVVGTVIFNPIGADVELGADGEKEPLKAYIDYLIYDPRIIVKDIQFPRHGDFDNTVKINLGLGGILSAGSPESVDDGSETQNPDEPTFEGLIRGSFGDNAVNMQIGRIAESDSDLIIKQSVLIIDTQTGLRVFPEFEGDEETPGDIEIDYEKGVVIFNTSNVKLVNWQGEDVITGVNLTDRVLRFYFRTADDWIVRMCKLPSSFISATGGDNYNTNNKLDWNEYGFIKNGDRIYFPQAYAGGDVLVDYEGTDGNMYSGKLLRISDYPENDGEAACYADLGRDCKDIISVKGASVILGSYWKIGDEFKCRQMLFDVYGK
ncbi:MAG: hypothetical protein KBT47_02040 [Armatimonadetes bacterium]|nr:hypothetical protein [Candidatus Hippobium faecium]